MANPFYKLKAGDKLYRIDFKYDENNELNKVESHILECARDRSIENYIIKIMAYDRSNNDNPVLMGIDCNHLASVDWIYVDDDETKPKRFVTTSKRTFDNIIKTYTDKL